ncbi:MAG: hypothetical protein LBV00_03290 [Propionibacteriaceae bacterium]|jgi:hypothetical protein|nr:hypothetical protein [Propionibacteriaceae bacterium]
MTIFDSTDRWLCQLWATYQTPPGTQRSRLCGAKGERGSVTIENVIWAVAVIAIAGIVVFAITEYVKGTATKLSPQ